MPTLYDIRHYQEELDLPKAALIQEVVTRWWSVLGMLESLNANMDAIILALNYNKHNDLYVNVNDQTHIKQIIELLSKLKLVGEKLGDEKDVTISQIVPWIDHLNEEVLIDKETDSTLIKTMKEHMRKKTKQ